MHRPLTGAVCRLARGTDLATGDEQRAPDGGGRSEAGRSHVVQDGQGAIHVASIGSYLDHGVVCELAALLKCNTLLLLVGSLGLRRQAYSHGTLALSSATVTSLTCLSQHCHHYARHGRTEKEGS